jgi:hypothetical protein
MTQEIALIDALSASPTPTVANPRAAEESTFE